MKHSILALAAAAALGMAGSAHAVVHFGDAGSRVTGERIRVEPNGRGHALIMPYFNSQGATVTMLNLLNSDRTYGKAVKVNVRDAANGSSLAHFTVLLAPDDIWVATIDNSSYIRGNTNCMLNTASSLWDAGINAAGLSLNAFQMKHLSDEEYRLRIGEGSLEFIVMADIAPGPLLDAIKSHQCKGAQIEQLFTPQKLSDSEAQAFGLRPSKGELSGIYAIINQERMAAYSGGMTAIRVETYDGKTGTSKVVFAPESTSKPDYCPDGNGYYDWTSCFVEPIRYLSMEQVSADPLLHDLTAWFEVPDLSTPLIPAFGEPEDQLRAIAEQMGRTDIVNDAVSEPKGSVPMLTDWVISDPLRRYALTVDRGETHYGETGSVDGTPAKIVYGRWRGPYGRATLKTPFPGTKEVACVDNATWGNVSPAATGNIVEFRDREGGATVDIKGGYPGMCGSVSTIGFAQESPMNARATRTVLTLPKTAGWVRFGGGDTAFPITGFAASSAKNLQSGIIYSTTWAHR